MKAIAYLTQQAKEQRRYAGEASDMDAPVNAARARSHAHGIEEMVGEIERLREQHGKLLASVTGHEDPSLWYINWVAGLCKQYEREHDWDEDEDVDATRQMLETVQQCCQLVWAAIDSEMDETK